MSDSEATEADTAAAGEGDPGDLWSRTTAPQTPYTMRQVGIGLAVFVVLAIIAFGIPLAAA